MALWLLCCVLLFMTSRGYDWLSHQSWFMAPELSLPWVMLGGLGLAIASNRDVWHWVNQQLPLEQSNQAAPPTLSPTVSKSVPKPNAAVSESVRSPVERIPVSPTRPAAKAITSKTSISFKITGPPPSSDA